MKCAKYLYMCILGAYLALLVVVLMLLLMVILILLILFLMLLLSLLLLMSVRFLLLLLMQRLSLTEGVLHQVRAVHLYPGVQILRVQLANVKLPSELLLLTRGLRMVERPHPQLVGLLGLFESFLTLHIDLHKVLNAVLAMVGDYQRSVLVVNPLSVQEAFELSDAETSFLKTAALHEK